MYIIISPQFQLNQRSDDESKKKIFYIICDYLYRLNLLRTFLLLLKPMCVYCIYFELVFHAIKKAKKNEIKTFLFVFINFCLK